MDDQPEITFLSENEGSECSSCPEVPVHLVPRQACATIKRPKDDIVHISCQPLPELCVVEFRNRYSEFFQRVEKNFEKHLLLKNKDSENKSLLLAPSLFNNTIEKIISSTIPSVTRTTKVPSIINSKVIINNDDHLKMLLSKNLLKNQLMKNHLKQKFIDNITEKSRNETTNFMINKLNIETPTIITSTISTTTNHKELILPLLINKQFDEELLTKKNFTLNEKSIIITNFSLPSKNESNIQFFKKNKRISNNTITILRNNQPHFLNNLNKTNKFTQNNTVNDTFLHKKDNESCDDKSKICCFWALTGECTTNPFWMRINCPQACGTCGCKLKNADKCISTGIKCQLLTTTPTKTDEIPSTTTTSTTKISTFQKSTTQKIISIENDKIADIKKLNMKSTKNDSDFLPILNKNMFLNNKNIKQIINMGITFPDKTTKITTIKTTIPTTISTTTIVTTTTNKQKKLQNTNEKPCKDHHNNCKFWSLLGECIKNPFWMKTQCEKSCNTCGIELDKIFAPTPHPGCYNHHKLCQFWAFNGECEKNPNWMLIKCKLSCRVC